LKLTQAINDGDYSEERLNQLLALSKKGLSAMQNIQGFDYSVYKKVLLDGVIGTVKVPKNLAGCAKEKDTAAKAAKSSGGTGTGGYAPHRVVTGCTWVETKSATEAAYAIKVEGGEVQVYTNMKERDEAYAKKADLIINVENKTPQQVATKIIKLLNRKHLKG
jgi:hypothetical protein